MGHLAGRGHDFEVWVRLTGKEIAADLPASGLIQPIKNEQQAALIGWRSPKIGRNHGAEVIGSLRSGLKLLALAIEGSQGGGECSQGCLRAGGLVAYANRHQNDNPLTGIVNTGGPMNEQRGFASPGRRE